MDIAIGLMGKSGTGKTTVANFLKNMFTESGAASAKVFSFATPIKKELQMLDDPVAFRKAAQSLGDSLVKNNPNYLVDKAREAIEAEEDLDVVLFDDIRRLQEVEFIRSLGPSLIIYLRVPEEDRLERLKERDGCLPDESIKNHSTENISLLNAKPVVVVDNIELDETKMLLEAVIKLAVKEKYPRLAMLSSIEFVDYI